MTEKAFENRAIALRRKAVVTCLSCGASEMLADDIAQNVIIKLWQIRDQLYKYQSLDSLVVVIARHELANHYRNIRTVQLSDIDTAQLPSNLNAPDQSLITSQEMSWLYQAMKSLPSTQYTVLHMRQVEHRSFDEIAQLLGIENSSARSLLSKARMWLLQEIKKRDSQ